MLKAELRKIYLKRQKSLSPADRTASSRRIAERFFTNFDLREIVYFHCFLPIEKFNEIDTRIFFEKIHRDFPHVETLAPRVNFQTGEIENLKFAPDTALRQNQWQIHEPTHDELIETEKIDVILVPLLCFDRHGFRVGYGKGFYDRLLKNRRLDCPAIGLSYFEPIAQIEDAQNFDVHLDYCVTPENIYKSPALKREKV